MANAISTAVKGALAVILPKSKAKPDGTSITSTYNPTNTGNVISLPTYRDHLTDIFSSRTSLDSRALIKSLMVNDPDMSATVNAFLTVADTRPIMLVKDLNGQLDPAGQQLLNQIIMNLTTRMDYQTQGFKIVKALNHITEEMRYIILAGGVIGAELVLNKEFWPTEIRTPDMSTVEWFEKKPGQYTPQQTSLNGDKISLDIPTFCCEWFRQDPTTIYSVSPFVSAINTIAARQQIINDLYRIMQITGYPRMDVTVLEEVIVKNMPAEFKATETARQQYIRSQLSSITNTLGSLRPEQAFVHTDSVTVEKGTAQAASMALDIKPIIETLNAQNQAGLKIVSTLIGRGTAGVNTSTVEARIFAMNADGLNKPVANLLSQLFTLALRLTGSVSKVEVSFADVELRGKLELEPQLVMKAARLKEDLSLGIITDEEYHLEMYYRLPPEGYTPLSGTGFMASGSVGVDASNVSPNSDPLGKSITTPGSKSAKSNAVKKPAVKASLTALDNYLEAFGK